MSNQHTHEADQGREYRLPLPGFYPVLTWQLNATVHQATGLAKFVSILREPSDHVEIFRSFGELEPWAVQRPVILDGCMTMLSDINMLLGIGTPKRS